MIADKNRDRDIIRLWAEHYPKSKTSGVSMTLCKAIALSLEDKAPLVMSYDDIIDKLHYLLSHYGISREQFYEIEKEIGDV